MVFHIFQRSHCSFPIVYQEVRGLRGSLHLSWWLIFGRVWKMIYPNFLRLNLQAVILFLKLFLYINQWGKFLSRLIVKLEVEAPPPSCLLQPSPLCYVYLQYLAYDCEVFYGGLIKVLLRKHWHVQVWHCLVCIVNETSFGTESLSYHPFFEVKGRIFH